MSIETNNTSQDFNLDQLSENALLSDDLTAKTEPSLANTSQSRAEHTASHETIRSETEASRSKVIIPKPGLHRKSVPPAVISTSLPGANAQPDLSRLGYIDSQGKVWRKNPTGDVIIAEWHAGDEISGLQHFHQKYQELASEVAILQARLHNSADADKIAESAQKLAMNIYQSTALGDIDSLHNALMELIEAAKSKAEQDLQKQQALLASTLERKTQIVELAQKLAESEDWKTTGNQFNELGHEWDELNNTFRHDDSHLWKKFSKAKETFNRRRGAYFSALDKRKAEGKNLKDELIAKAEKLVTPFLNSEKEHNHDSWIKGSQDLRDLLTEWKGIGRVDKTTDDAQWAKFKSVNDAFYAKRNELQALDQSAREEIAQLMQEKIDFFQQKTATANITEKRKAYHKLMKDIDTIPGQKPDKKHKIYMVLKSIEKSLKEQIDKDWKQDNPESKARAEQFLSKVAKLQEQAEKAQLQGDEKLAAQLLADAQQWQEWADAALNSVNKN